MNENGRLGCTHLSVMQWLGVPVVLLLALFDPLRALAGSRFHERNHTGLLALFGFDDGQRSADLHPTTARDYTGLGLLGNLTTSTSAIAWTADRAGFTIPSDGGGSRATSQLSTASLIQSLTDEFSIEMFLLNPSNQSPNNVLVAGFGDWPPGSAFPQCDSGASTVEGGWRLYAPFGSGMRFQAVMQVDSSPSCLEVTFPTSPSVLRHAVLRANGEELSAVSHGGISVASDTGVHFNPSLWSRHAAHLTFAVPHPSEAWKGSIFMWAIYNRYLSTAEVAQNRIYGPPNSLPVATAAATPLALTEDVTATLYP